MSVFEDLIDELRNENLLEDTVVNPTQADAAAGSDRQAGAGAVSGQVIGGTPDDPASGNGDRRDVPQIEKPASDSEFFRKRAIDEVSSLQMVEHVFAGVEREHLKVSSVAFDDLNAKKALHKFLQVSDDSDTPEHAEAELAMRQETEAWNFALNARDQKISVANIRRFCEGSKPGLSSQALISLARFYRNSPFTEDVRSKFEYVMTRLFSRESGDEQRQLLFAHDEMIGHINTLYANWSSIALYTSKDDQVEVLLTITRFQEFTVEVESAETFDELLETDFFTRVRSYKEESAEMFYVPEVLAAAIKCNLAIGNRYVELIGRERSKKSAAVIEEKYGANHDNIVSDAAGKTLLLSDVLTLDPKVSEDDENGQVPTVRKPAPLPPKRSARTEEKEDSKFSFPGVNKWLMVVCVVMLLAGGGVYLWAEKFAGGGEGEAITAKPVEIGDAELKKFLRKPSFTNETLFAVTDPSYETLTEDERRALLSRAWQFAQEQKLQKVSLLNNEGRSVAFASKDRLELIGK